MAASLTDFEHCSYKLVVDFHLPLNPDRGDAKDVLKEESDGLGETMLG